MRFTSFCLKGDIAIVGIAVGFSGRPKSYQNHARKLAQLKMKKVKAAGARSVNTQPSASHGNS